MDLELYNLDETFLKDKVFDEYVSMIWTERFRKNGDVQLSLVSSPDRLVQLKEGKFLRLKGADELMFINSALVEGGVLTIKGFTPETFFNERFIRTSADPNVNEWTIVNKAGTILATIVTGVAITGTASVGLGTTEENIIPNLVLGDIDTSGPTLTQKVPFGPAYDAMQAIGETAKVGMRLRLNRADPFGYEFSFDVYKGEDRTSDQLENDLVRFTAASDTLTNMGQISTIVGYKTVVYVFPPSWSSATPPTVVYAPGSSADARGFDRRVLVIQASDISEDDITGGATLASLMQQAGKDALANNNYTKLVDGEVVPQPQYIYGTHYKLGDIIELEGPDGTVQKAQITEYIRSKDAAGEKAYPTVSIVD